MQGTQLYDEEYKLRTLSASLSLTHFAFLSLFCVSRPARLLLHLCIDHLVSAPPMEMIDAELRLGPPGGSDVVAVQPARKRSSSVVKSEASGTDDRDAAAPASKVQVVGWPPVRAYRKNAFHAAVEAASASAKKGEQLGMTTKQQGAGLYVKVSMDGAPYLRKVDLQTFGGYRELRDALDALFGCFSSSPSTADGAGAQFAVAYEDKDGDLMLAGDVPWDMFICSCKKLRIMRGSEAR